MYSVNVLTLGLKGPEICFCDSPCPRNNLKLLYGSIMFVLLNSFLCFL